MGSTISYTDLRENLEKGVCQTWQHRHSPPACQIRPKCQVHREICSWTTWDHHSPRRKSRLKPWCAELAWETWLSQHSKC